MAYFIARAISCYACILLLRFSPCASLRKMQQYKMGRSRAAQVLQTAERVPLKSTLNTSEKIVGSLGDYQLDFWALSFNRGSLSESEMSRAVHSLVTEAAIERVNVLIITTQESGGGWVPKVPGWTVYRVRLSLLGQYSLQTFVISQGVVVKTQKLHPDLPFPTWTLSDADAPGCLEHQSESKGCWGTAVYHECKSAVTTQFCTKGTLIVALDIVPECPPEIDATGLPWRKWPWEDNRTETERRVSPTWSSRLVVVNSHFGAVKNPLDEQILKRARHLTKALKLLDFATEGYVVPAVMLGDWNFRMSPLRTLQKTIDPGVNTSWTELSQTVLPYTGPVLWLHTDEKMRYSMTTSTENGSLADGFYDEVRLGLALAQAKASGTLTFDWPSELDAFSEMLKAHLNELGIGKNYRLTCRYKEGEDRTTIAPKAFERGAVHTTSEQLWYQRAPWVDFEAAGHELKLHKKGERKGEVARIPSVCDRIFTSPGSPEVLFQALGESFSEYAPLKDPDGADGVRATLEGTDHVPILARMRLAFQKAAAANGLLRTVPRQRMKQDQDTSKNKCCCKTSSIYATSVVNPDTCKWQAAYSASRSCSPSLGKFGRTEIFGVAYSSNGLMDAEHTKYDYVADSDDPQNMCEQLIGTVHIDKDTFGPVASPRKKKEKFVLDRGKRQ